MLETIEAQDFLTWLEEHDIELRTKTYTPDGIAWIPLYKDVGSLINRYKTDKEEASLNHNI